MNRRQFLSFASVPIAAAVVVPELVQTIFLPPRGGWPTWWSVDTANGARDFTTAIMRYVSRERHMMSAAEFRRILQPGLEQVFREAYAQAVLLEDGTHAKLFDDWAELFAYEAVPAPQPVPR